MAQVVSAAVTAKLRDSWEVVDRVRHLETYDFEGSSDVDVVDKWFKRVIKVFKLMKLTDFKKMDNKRGLLQGRADNWFHGYIIGMELCDLGLVCVRISPRAFIR